MFTKQTPIIEEELVFSLKEFDGTFSLFDEFLL
jgi:hypothetical protein